MDLKWYMKLNIYKQNLLVNANTKFNLIKIKLHFLHWYNIYGFFKIVKNVNTSFSYN